MMQAIPTGTPGVSNVGLVKIRSVEALETEKQNREPATAQRVVDSLTSHLSKLLFAAKRAKEPIERQMLRNMRQVYGEYEPEKLAAIRQMGGSEVFVLLTMTKYRAAVAWVNDILRPVGDRPWTIAPTPLSDLPPDVEGQIKREGDDLYQMIVQNLSQLGMMAHPEYVNEEIQKYEDEVRDRTRKEIQQEAKKRSERMAQKIDDQLVEGGWNEAFWAVISDLIMLKAGILKGPVVRRRPVHSWTEKDGSWNIDVEDKLVPEYDRVSPFDFYPLSGATTVNDGGFERHHLTRSDLVAMIGVPGYREAHIRAALNSYGASGKREILATDSQLALLRDGQTMSLLDSGRIEAWEFWGSLQGRLLQEWGLPVADADIEYEVNAWMVGEHTIRLVLNPDKLGRKPYAVDSFERVPGAFWGKGLPELMADIQDVCNATARAMVNNSGLASGPQVEVDKSRCGDVEEIWPWKIWPSTNAQMSEAPAIRFTQPQIVVGPLLTVFQTFSAMADEQTGVPKWAHGGDPGESTASGMSMRMTYAARGIKEVIAHIDTMVASVIGRTYDYNMLYDPDPSIKGDARIVARGSSSLLAKEQKLVRTNEFLAATINPVDMQIIGIKGRAKLLREAAKLLELDTEGVVPDSDSEIEQLQALIAQAEMQGVSPQGGSQPGSGVTPQPKPAPTDAAGTPQGGTDTNAFQNQKGVRT